MEDVFHKILRSRFGGGKPSAEWGYNLIHALEAHKYDADCEIFLEVLRGNLHENVYYDQMSTIDNLYKEVEKLDYATTGHKSGMVDMEELMSTLYAYFSQKDVDEMSMIHAALVRTCQVDLAEGDTHVAYEELFHNTKDMCETPFVETIRDQHLHGIQAFIVEVMEAAEQEGFTDTCVPN